MGLFDGRSVSYSAGDTRPASSRQNSTRAYSPARSTRSTHSTSNSNNKGYFVRPAATSRGTSNFFGSSSSSRGFGGGSSAYKRSPRQGYINYLFHKLQRMLRELWYYARKHPLKAFFAVVVPLLSAGGAIHGLMKQFGVRVPGMDSRSMRGYGGGGAGGMMDNAGSLMQIAKALM